MGNEAGYNITTQTDNVCIGNQAGYITRRQMIISLLVQMLVKVIQLEI